MEADWRGLPGYSVQFQIQDTLKLTVRELDIPRTAEEFSTLDTQIRQKFPLSVSGILMLPETFSIDSLNDCISVFMTTDTLRPPSINAGFSADGPCMHLMLGTQYAYLYDQEETLFEC